MSRFFSGIFGSLMKSQPSIEKRLKNTCFLKENYEEIDYDDLLKVLSFLQGRTDTKQPIAISELFTHIKDSHELSLQRRLKYLALIHKSIKKIGFEFAEEFLESRPNNLREKPTSSGSTATGATQTGNGKSAPKSKPAMVFQYMDIESWLEEYLVKHYYDYLMRLALNLETYKTCLLVDKEQQPTIHNSSSSHGTGGQTMQQPLRMMVLFKVSNMVNFVMKLQKQFAVIFSEFKFIAIAKDIAYMVLKDCVVYYNFMHKQIMNMVTNYENMVENDQMQFYELFIELIKLNSALHDFGKLRKFFDEEDSIEQPMVLNITKERARQIDRNHRKIVLKNEEIQRDRRIKLQQQANGGSGGSSVIGKTRLSFFPRQQTGSMTSRGHTWQQNEQIREVTNDDEEEEYKTKIQKQGGKFRKITMSNHSMAMAGGGNGSGGDSLKVPGLNLEGMYGLGGGQSEPLGGAGGFNTDRVVYSHSLQAHEDENSDSTKESNNKKEEEESGRKQKGKLQTHEE